MTSFCPYCGNILLIDNMNELQYFCTTCPYVFKITKPVYNEIPVKKKELDAVLDEETWKNAQKTDSGSFSLLVCIAFLVFVLFFGMFVWQCM